MAEEEKLSLMWRENSLFWHRCQWHAYYIPGVTNTTCRHRLYYKYPVVSCYEQIHTNPNE